MLLPKTFSWFLAVRYLLTRWVNLIGMFGIALAVWAMIVVIAVFSGFIGEARRGIDDASPNLLLTSLRPGSDFQDLQPALEAIDGVAAVAPRVTHFGMLVPHRGRRLAKRTASIPTANSTANRGAVMLVGIDAELESRAVNLQKWMARDLVQRKIDSAAAAIRELRYDVADPAAPFDVKPERIARAQRRLTGAGDPPLGTQPGVLLGSLRLNYGDEILPGQKVDIVSAWHDKAADSFQPIRMITYLSGAFHTGHRMFDLSVCMLDIDQMRDHLGEGDDRELVTDIAVRAAPGADRKTLRAAILEVMKEHGGCEALDYEEQNATYLGAVDQERAMMKLVLFAVMLVAGFLIFATLHMMVAQKTKDIGILTSLGATPGGIGAIFVVGGLVVGVAGCALGTLTGCVSVWSLNYINDKVREMTGQELFPTHIYSLDEVPTDLDPVWMLQVVGGALILSFIVSWLPARRAARMDPVKALMHD